MAAVTSTTVFTTTPLAGINVGAKGSTQPQGLALLTKVGASNGHTFIVVRASEALGSTSTVKIGAAGSASSDAGSAGWTMNCPGGAAIGQTAFAQRTTLA